MSKEIFKMWRSYRHTSNQSCNINNFTYDIIYEFALPPPPPPPHHRKNQTIVDPNLNNHVFYVCYLQVSLCTMILPLMRSLAWSYQYQFCLKMVTLCVQCCLIQALQFHYWVKNENVTLTFLQHHLIHIITLLRVSATL